MQKSFSWFLNRKLLIKDTTIKNIAGEFIAKARNNIATMELLNKAKSFKDILEFPKDYSPDEWIAITAYYSMYVAALGLLAKLEYRSKNHSATITALDELFVKKRLLEKEYLEILEKINIKKEEIEELERVRDKREIAQYSVTKKTTQNIAEEARTAAHKFTDKMEEIFDLL